MGKINRATYVVIFALFQLLLETGKALAGDDRAVSSNCPKEVRVIGSEPPSQQAEICRGARDALAFLADYGLIPTAPIEIELVDRPLEHNGVIALGSYDRRSGKINLMSLGSIEELERFPLLLGQPLDKDHYRGGVAHEIAHALFHQNGPDAQLSNAAQEYLAYVTQLAVLPVQRRRQMIESAGVDAWKSGDTISEVYMAFAPEKFAVKSYLHFIGMSDPQAFVKTLLNVKWFYVYVP